MPSAASNVKVEKQISDNALADNSTPLRQAITVIEHKIRNLEKRKSKLESYKELQNAGKTLNDDQKTAVAKFNEVIQTLDFARDLCKQFIGIVAVTEKEAKKQAKREAALKNQAELARLREILLVQDALNQMGTENVRDDFLNGKNGAAQLTESDLKLLDDLYPAVTPKHEAGNPTAFTNEVQAAAEHLLAVVDGKPKEIFGGTYCQIKEVLGKIHESGYFDQAQVYECYEEPAAEMEQQPEGQPLDSVAAEQPMPPHADLAHQIPIESLSIEQQVPVQQQMPPQAVHAAPPHQPQHQVMEQQPPPSAPPQVQMEQLAQHPQQEMYHQQQVPPLQVVQQQPPRPITEMLGTGSFFFLQESEIDPQEQQQQQQQQIPTQTYTNQQQFVPGMHMPPPLQMPQHFQQPPHVGNMPPAMGMQPPLQQQQQQQAPAQQPTPVAISMQKNGNMIEERDDSQSDVAQHNGNQKYPPHQRNQNYYQNNGYPKDNYNNKDYKDNYNQRSRQSNRNGNSKPQNRH
ncbi:unnamed protein product [Brassicogethes aeneus]|uniref:Caprin-1 dimerization domain-containing protein n=1 Tax=Brassicogethes aeneus TaxID=1431903 RepID=A0A9P0BE74_BRAAE|nr:unnamed protein product [Brassicogethes aeneus]